MAETNVGKILNSVAHDPRFTEGELDEVTRLITETASRVMHCQRTSIWRYAESGEGKSIECLTLYDATTGEYSSGGVLTENDAASYLNGLDRESLIVINDVATDPRCVELNQAYLPSQNISSMLDAPFQYNGKLGGVICCEHVGEKRRWTDSEQHFAANMASLVTIAMERNTRRETESQLREQENLYRTLVEDLAVGYCISVDNEIVFVNKAAEEIGELLDYGLIGGEVADFFPGTTDEQLAGLTRQLHETKQSTSFVREFRIRNNRKLILEYTISAINWSGQPAIQSLIKDITQEATAIDRVRDSERLLSQAEHIARMGSWVHDLETDQFECSEALKDLVGIAPEDMGEQPLLKRVLTEDRPRLIAAQESAKTTRRSYHISYRINTSDGILWLEEHGAAEFGQDGQAIRIQGSSRDITRQKLAELEAMATEERFSALGNAFPGGFVYCDLSARFLFINRTFASWFDVEPSAYYGKPANSLIVGQYWEPLERYVNNALEGKSVTFEMASPNLIEGIDHVRVVLAPDVKPGGDMQGFFALITDTSEVRNMEQMLRQAQRMEALGQLTGGIAHDFNNILAILMGNLELAAQRSADPASKDYISAALKGVERGVELSRKLLGFARSSSAGSKEVRVNKIIDDMRPMFTQSLGSNVELHVTKDEDLWVTRIDQGDFEDALLNLCANARDAMPDGGRLIVHTSNRSLDETSHKIHPSLRPGSYVLISISDTGSGMDAETKERLFEPFYTTKPQGKSTGLGLSMVFGFVKRSRGQIVVYSALGEGSTINIYLPVAANEVSDPAPPEEFEPSIAPCEDILIVDDESMIADVAAGILNELGYSTRIATNATEALQRIEESPPDLLFSDVVMPGGLNGFQLAEKARAIQPGLRILLTSGFNKYASNESEYGDLEADTLTKPYNRQELADSVRNALTATRQQRVRNTANLRD